MNIVNLWILWYNVKKTKTKCWTNYIFIMINMQLNSRMITHFPDTFYFMGNSNSRSSSDDSRSLELYESQVLIHCWSIRLYPIFNVTLVITFNSRSSLNKDWDEVAEPPTNNSVTLIIVCKHKHSNFESPGKLPSIWKNSLQILL